MGLEREQVQGQGAGVTFTQFIQGVAAAAKLNVQVKSPELVVVPWDFEGRGQNTFVRFMGETGNGDRIISFFSPALKLAAGQELGQKTCNELLRKNAALAHGAWGIVRIESDDYLGVVDTQTAQTMEPTEFYASAIAVAKVADDMEKQLGTDVF
ncbi:MAG: hypothetical protein HY926_10185 [Elusimicrobia bacterium]|nr:hypothetical protein [Elusimicrobiota bacterium]